MLNANLMVLSVCNVENIYASLNGQIKSRNAYNMALHRWLNVEGELAFSEKQTQLLQI